MSFLTGIWGYVISGVVGAAMAAGATYYIVSMPYKLEIANLQKTQAQQNTVSVEKSIAQLEGFIKNVTTAGLAYERDRNNLAATITKIHGDFVNATKATPLPPDCKPDDGRLRNLTAAVAAANAHTGAGVGPVPTVPHNP